MQNEPYEKEEEPNYWVLGKKNVAVVGGVTALDCWTLVGVLAMVKTLRIRSLGCLHGDNDHLVTCHVEWAGQREEEEEEDVPINWNQFEPVYEEEDDAWLYY